MKGAYTKPGRLSDVLALIQVLSLDEYTHRTESGITEELQSDPSSSDSWIELAREHPEFFRVRADDKNLSLVARHVMPRGASGNKEPLSSDIMQKLLQTAIDLHDRQVKAKEWWKTWIPVASTILAGLIACGTTLLVLYLNGWCKP